jgi:hypothetical protein
MYKRFLITALSLSLSLAAGRADTLNATIPNFSFELPASGSDQINHAYGNQPTQLGNITDWSLYAPITNSNYGTVNYSADSTVTGGLGSQGAYLTGEYQYRPVYLVTGNATNYDSALGATGYVGSVVADTTYKLTVEVASYGTPTYDGGNSVALNLIDSSGTFATTTIPYSDLTTTLTDYSLTFTSSATPSDVGEGLQIELGDNFGQYVDPVVFDDVRLTESGPNIMVPEPSTWAMLLIGAGGLALLARRRLTA